MLSLKSNIRFGKIYSENVQWSPQTNGSVMQMYRQMRYFIAVVETNSFFEAGEG